MVTLCNLNTWIILMIIGQISVTTSNASLVSSQCYNYTLINDSTRSVNVTAGTTCDSSLFSSGAMWVRFVGVGGTQIPTTPVVTGRCDTNVPGWYSGQMPTAVDTTTSGTVCYNWVSNNCYFSNSISVTNCGSYFVYQLCAPSTCDLRYCTDMPGVSITDTTITSIEDETTSTEIETTVDGSTTAIQTTVDESTTKMQTTVDPSTTAVRTEQTTSTEIMTTSKLSITPQKCSSPKVTLIPGTSTLSSPIQFHRSDDFNIISTIELNCNGSLSTVTQWKIKNCSSTCSYQIQLDQTIKTTFTELYIPAKTLPYGIYELQLTVTMTNLTNFTTSSSVYVQIASSGITVNLVQLGTSMITIGYDQDLNFNPGAFSVDPDGYTFNESNWKYIYYCRIYGLYMFPNLNGVLLSIDDNRTDPLNPSCFANQTRNGTKWKYGTSLKSSLTILANSLQPNQTYQFMVYMENRQNSSTQATGYVLVTVGTIDSQMIAVGCVIWTMCTPNLEFQLVNPTTQVALFSLCIGDCDNIQNITWNIYQGTTNISSNSTQWTLFNQMNIYENIWFFGWNTSNFTALNQLFLNNPQINLWRFQVIYEFTLQASSSALNFVINQPPVNGSCSISPYNGTTSTSFNISCSNWFDEDGIKDYSIYAWTTDPQERTFISFSSLSIFQVRLPSGDDQTSLLHLNVQIRDTLDCITEYNMSSITVLPDTLGITNLLNNLQSSSNALANDPTIQLLSSGNQNIIGQIIGCLSQQSNKMNSDAIDQAVSSGIPAASISVSQLGCTTSQGNSTPLNATALIQYKKDLNSHANLREYLMTFTTNLDISTSNNIKLQASSLAQLTQATNQLTRTALTLALDKCYQLSLALYSMVTRISYEDIQIITTQLIQCATNILTAVNGPLQQRTDILDLDSSRATAFPTDYDTDLESAWSNPNLFSDGNDFSWETIQQGRNTYYQKQLANQVTTKVNQILSLLTSISNIQLNIGQNLIINTSSTFMSLETISMKSLSNKQVQQVGNARINIPKNFKSNISDNSTVSLRSMMEPLAPLGNSKLQTANTNLSRSISLSVVDRNGNEVLINTDSTDPIEIIIPRDPNVIIPSMIIQNVTTSINSAPHNQLFSFHYINITNTLSVSVHIEIHPLETNISYLFIYKFDQIPQLNTSINIIDEWTVFCPFNLTNESMYTYFIDNQQTSGHQSIIFGLRELNTTENNDYCFNSSILTPPITNERFNFTENYEVRIYTSGCYYLDKSNQWQSDGLRVGRNTNYYETQCFSTHLTTFSSGFQILPQSVNWNYVFANADFIRNKTIYLTIICVSLCYIGLIIFARYKDKKDIEKLGVTPLPDNQKSDEYFYQILVFTGQRRNAGTKSKVHFVLSGNDDSTTIRTFADPHRTIFQRGGIDAFILAVPKSLGLLNFIRIWHDNTGQGSSSSWFLKYLIIRDLQTMEKFHFISQRWFAVEKDDGKIERSLPVASEMEKCDFSYVLSKQSYHSISDSHLWFSIFSRPPSSKFTRVQRCTCCFVLIIISMFLNIMYYDLKNESTTTNSTSSISLSFGSVSITSEQVIIGIIVELFALIPSLLLVQLFRRLRSRQQQISPLRQALYKMKSSLSDKDIDENKNKHKSGLTLAWWWIFIAYGLCIILVGVSILFIIARGIEFGDSKTQKWLISIISGLFSSILLTQPLKILCLAIFFAYFCRNSNDDKEANEYLDDNQVNLDNDEEYLHSKKNNRLFTYRPPIRANRLNEAEVMCARDRRLKEIQMWSIIRETLLYICFLSLLYTVIFSNCQSNSYSQVKHLQNFLLNSRQMDDDYTKISTINQYWNWLENSFISNIRAQQWYNGDAPKNLSGFINDKSSRLIGWVTMRQLRIKSDLCPAHVNEIISTCRYDYSFSNEDKNSYKPGWVVNETIQTYSSSINQSFIYSTSKDLDTYIYVGDHGTYGSGGYVYEFRGRLVDLQSNLSQLHALGWIDNQTRAVIIQLSLYNPNVQLFTSVSLLVEFLSTGAIYSSASFEPMNFDEIRLLLELKGNYFRRFWSYIDVGIIACSWTIIGVYIWRFNECKRIGKLFNETNGYVYINLQLASYINNILIYLFGFCCFFGTIKFVRLCRYSQRLSLFIVTIQNARNELISFSLMFSIVYMAFVCLFYLLFVSKLESCSSLLASAQMLFEMTLMKFNSYEISEAASFLGPFCFSLFIFIVVFICMSMFLTIIADNFRCARKNINNDKQEIFSFMLERFQHWIGWKKATEEDDYEARDVVMRSEYFHPIERFPERIDELLDVINRIYMTQKMEISKMDEIDI
ncbi:unnamed protein product [Adineta steineri]|uniref:PLAT domain-containing protein n=1 Tax=Adineta steineri TaxID=433720 RepID=A0A813S2C0_9BILA|nr:unnamed protein product [Adineta steineri]CAF3844173.1 unnamed protein product [Adineta steineri]